MKRKTAGRRFFFSLGKKFQLAFLIAAACGWAAFRYLPLLPALLALAVLAAAAGLLVNRLLVRPLRALTLSVLESRPQNGGLHYVSPHIRTGDELELLSEALARMAGDQGRPGSPAKEHTEVS